MSKHQDRQHQDKDHERHAQKIKEGGDSKPRPADVVGKEVDSGRSELIDGQKKQIAHLKRGGRSGVTDLIGKPMLVDEKIVDKAVGNKRSLEAVQPADQNKVPDADYKRIERAADEIRKATKRDNLIDTGTDEEAIFRVLKGLPSQAQRDDLKKIYEQKYGISLNNELKGEMSGAELDKAFNLLDRIDSKTDDAARLHTALVERGQLIMGRSNAVIEADIRTTLSTMNSKEISELKEDYKAKYHQDLSDALKNDNNLSQDAKDAAIIYLKGIDKRTNEDVLNLAEIAMKAQDLEQFKEVFRHATAEQRKYFLDHDGDQKMVGAFRGVAAVFFSLNPKNATSDKLETARELARYGRKDVASDVKDNTSILGDNEKAIEFSLKSMKASDRERYIWGRELVRQNADIKELEGFDKDSFSYYKKLRAALESAGNSTEVARWEDMIAHKGGTLISKLAEQRGILGRHDTNDVLSAIEQMSKDDWERLRTDKDFRNDLQSMMKTFMSKDEIERVNGIINKMLEPREVNFEKARESSKRPILETIKDNLKWHGNEKQKILEAIANLSQEEQARYRTDKLFREDLDKSVVNALGEGALGQSARHLLDKVSCGQPPKFDVVTTTLEHASHAFTDKGQVLADVQKAFRDDSKLRERVLHPKNEADLKLVDELRMALISALGVDDFTKHAQTLLITGDVSMTSQVEFSRGKLSDNKERFFHGLANASPYERDLLQNKDNTNSRAREFQSEILGPLSMEEKEVAKFVLAQKQIRPEDAMRLVVLGASKDTVELKSMLGQLSPGQRARAHDEYMRKYGADPTYALLDTAKGEDREVLANLLYRPGVSQRQLFNEARDRYGESRSGIGASLVDSAWDGTGHQVDAAMDTYAKVVGEASRRFTELPADKQKMVSEQLGEAISLYRESKEGTADALVDTVLAVGAVLAAPETGGVSLGYLLLAAGAAGATAKVASKAVVMGNDYEWTASQVSADLAVGFASGASNFFGPAEVAQMFKMGEKAGLVAAEKAVKKIAVNAVEVALKPESEEILKEGMKKLVRTAIAHGEASVDNVSILKLADKMIAPEITAEARQQAMMKVADSMRDSLSFGVEEEARGALKKILRKAALNAGAGSAGGVASGVAEGAAHWDTRKSVAENMARLGEAALSGAGFGGVGAAAGSVALDGAKGLYRHMKEGALDKVGVRADQYRKDPLAPMLDYHHMREIEIRGQKYELRQRSHNDPWWYTKEPRKEPGPVKVHVSVSDTTDLGKIQKVLIPVLEDKDSEIYRLVADYRTVDPRWGIGEWSGGDPHFNEWHKLPNGEGIRARGFTIATETVEEAIVLQKKIDELLSSQGLGVEKPINANAMERVTGKSQRVSVTRDYFVPAFDKYGQIIGPQIDQQVVEAIHKKLAVPLDSILSSEQLRKVEREAGIKRGLLTYDRTGQLALNDLDHDGRTMGVVRMEKGKHGGEYPADYYLMDYGANTKEGEMTSRPALYNLAKKYANVDLVEIVTKR